MKELDMKTVVNNIVFNDLQLKIDMAKSMLFLQDHIEISWNLCQLLRLNIQANRSKAMETMRTSRPNAETKAPAENLYPQKERPQFDNTRRQTDFLSPRVSIKKTLLIALLLLTAALSFAEIYTIGNGDYENNLIPINPISTFGWSKCLFTANDLQTAGLNGLSAITGIGYNITGNSGDATYTNQEVYLRNTDLTVQNRSFPNIEDYILAYSGTITFSGNGWNSFELIMPFFWDGFSSLEIVWMNYHGETFGGTFSFKHDNMTYGFDPNYVSAFRFGYSESIFPTGDGSLIDYRPHLQLHVSQETSPLLAIYPTALDFGEIPLDGEAEALHIQALNYGQGTFNLSEADISISGSGADSFSFDASNLPATLETGESMQIPVSISTGTVGAFSATLTITYAGVAHDVSLSAIITPPGLVEIGDGTNHQPQPFDISWGYGRSATIYTMEDIGRVGTIESIGWYCASPSYQVAPYKIYVGPTLYDEMPYGYPDGYYANVIQGLTLVSQGNQAFNSIGWYMFDLDTPIVYSGENLLIAVETNYGNSGVSNCPYFRYTSGDTYSHCYWRTQNQPPSGSGHLSTYRPNLRLILSGATLDPQISINTPNIDFGTVFSGITTGPVNLTLSNTGVGMLVLNEDDVSLTGADAAMFSYDESVFPLTIFTNHIVTIPLYVTASREGNIGANFVINYAGEDHVVDLSAYAVAHHGSFFAQLGDGTAVNSETETPAPYGTQFRSFREQYLIKADELHAQNGGSGIIESIAFNVADLNDIGPMNNYRIRLKQTNQNELTTQFESGEYIEVFQTQTLTPQEGWNTHIFYIPFDWNGISNILVDILVSYSASALHNSSTYYTNYPHNCTLRWQANSSDGSSSTTGVVSTKRPNMKLFMQERNFMDIAAVSVTGNKLPSVDTNYNYTVRICNISPLPASGYQVKLVAQQNNNPPLIVESIEGVTLQPLEYADIEFSWTPTNVGDALIYGTIAYNYDEYPNNNDTPTLAVEVMEADYQVIQIGEGVDTNYYNYGSTPYGTQHRSFRQQFLYKADEIHERIGDIGLISGIGFNVYDLGDCSPLPNYRIRLKHTAQTSLSEEFELGDYTEVFNSPSLMPTVGWNTHIFAQPFVWNGVDNILVDIITDPLQVNITQSPLVYCTSTSFNSSIRFQSYYGTADGATSGTVFDERSNTRFYMEVDGMGNLTGTVMEGGYPVPNMLITVEDSIFKTTTNQDGVYHFPYVYAGTHTLTASKNCYTSVSHTIVVEEDEQTIQNFSVSGTPEFFLSDDQWDFGYVPLGTNESKDFYIINSGGDNLYINSISLSGSDAFTITEMPFLPMLLRSDEYITLGITFEPDLTGMMEANIIISDDQNSQFILTDRAGLGLAITNHGKQNRDSHDIAIIGTGVNSITVGEGEGLFRRPFDFANKCSVFQAIISNDDLDSFFGVITGIKLYNSFSTDLDDKPVKIWMASTPLSDLSEGWISSNDMSLVFDGLVSFPAGENTISIDFPNHFTFAESENLAVLFYRPVDTNDYSVLERFKCFNSQSNSTRMKANSYDNFDPANMLGGSLSSICPIITFEGIPGTAGQLQGVVHNAEGTPLSGVEISLSFRLSTTSDENGLFYLNNVLSGEHELRFTRFDYLTQTVDITIEEGTTLELDITMQDAQIVPMTGRVLIDYSDEGISGANIVFFNSAEYHTISAIDGTYTLSLYEGIYTAIASHPTWTILTVENVVITAGGINVLDFRLLPLSSEDVAESLVSALYSNYPNPFNPETTISYDLKEPAKVQLNVYNLKGQLVKTLVNSEQTAGRHNVVFTARDERGNKLSSGLYFYRLRAGDYIKTRKMMLME